MTAQTIGHRRAAEREWRQTDAIARDRATRGVAYRPAAERRGDVQTWRDVRFFLLGSFCGSLGLACVLMFIAGWH